MLKELRKLKLKMLGLQSLVVLAICLYYFVGMQVSTSEVGPAFVNTYKISFIVVILGIFAIFFSLHYRGIIGRLSTVRGVVVMGLWVALTILTKQPSLIFMMIIALTFYEKEYKKLAGYLFIWLTTLFVSFSILSTLGILESGEMLKYNLLIDISEYETVTALGMGNPNSAMAFLGGLVMSGAYIFYDTKSKRRYGILMLGVTLVVFSLVGSRTGLACILLFLALYFMSGPKMSHAIRYFTPVIMIVLIILSIFIGFQFGRQDNEVNDFLTTRPYQWNLRLEDGVLGNVAGNSDNYIISDGKNPYPLDNQYIYLIARAGWLAMFAVLALYAIGSRRNKSPVIAFMLLISLIQAFVESLMFTAVVNIGLLLILPELLIKERARDGNMQGMYKINEK